MSNFNTGLAVLGTVGTLASAVAAGASWRAVLRANNTADSVARIERDRWHADLTPRLQLEIRNDQHLRLAVRFDGPAGLRVLDRLILTVRDDRDRSGDNQLAGGATPEEIAKTIWGPYRLRPRIDNADETGRSVELTEIHLDETRLLALDPSIPPDWYSGADGLQRWRDQYDGTPLRLWAECHATGHKPWTVPFNVTPSAMPSASD